MEAQTTEITQAGLVEKLSKKELTRHSVDAFYPRVGSKASAASANPVIIAGQWFGSTSKGCAYNPWRS